jgi:hypothetical protein
LINLVAIVASGILVLWVIKRDRLRRIERARAMSVEGGA